MYLYENDKMVEQLKRLLCDWILKYILDDFLYHSNELHQSYRGKQSVCKYPVEEKIGWFQSPEESRYHLI